MADADIQRENMVESQVRPSDVTDRRLIRAMAAVPRHLFVPDNRRSVAYMDGAVPLLAGRELMAPRTFAKMAHALNLPDARATVMVGGCSTGYGVAVLARIAKRLVGVEPHQALADQARAALTREAITNAVIVSGTVADGSPAEAPFDGILLEGAVPELPKTLLDQLKDGGRLVAVLADGRVMKAVVAVRSGPSFDTRALFDAAAAPLPGFERAQAFTF